MESNNAVPRLCPVIFKNGKDSFFTLDPTLGPAKVAVYLAAVLVVLCVLPCLHVLPLASAFQVLMRRIIDTQSTPPSASSSTAASTHALNNANGSVRRNALPCLSGGPRTKRRLLPRRKKSLRERRRLCWSLGPRLRKKPGVRRLLGSRWKWMGWHVTWVEYDLDDSWNSWLEYRCLGADSLPYGLELWIWVFGGGGFQGSHSLH